MPIQLSAKPISTVTPSEGASQHRKPRHLSAIPGRGEPGSQLTRGQVAERIGISISTVRRYEGKQLHPTIDEHEIRWFTQAEVTALAAKLANESSGKSRTVGPTVSAPTRNSGELAALVFERFEQRQSLAEIVIGLRIVPATVRDLFDQWCLGLTEGHLRGAQVPVVARERDIQRATVDQLSQLLSVLPSSEATRISVARFRGSFQREDVEFADVVELGGFHVGGPCSVGEITGRFGPGDFRITAFKLTAGLLWELLVDMA